MPIGLLLQISTSAATKVTTVVIGRTTAVVPIGLTTVIVAIELRESV